MKHLAWLLSGILAAVLIWQFVIPHEVSSAQSRAYWETHAATLDVEEVIARRLLVNAKGYLVHVEDTSGQSAALVQRLANLGVKFAQEPAVITPNSKGTTVSEKTGKSVMIVRIGKVKWASPDACEVRGETSFGIMSGSSSLYILRRSPDGWHIVGVTDSWVS